MIPSELIARYGWVQGQSGNEIIGFCLSQALLRCSESYEIYKTKQEKIEMILGFVILSSWNDAPERTKDEVLAVLREVGL